MFNVSQLYSIPQFLRANFQEVNYSKRSFIISKEKKKRSTILQSRFLKDIIRIIWISSTKSWKMTCFRCNTTENLIFSLIYCQQKVDLNTSKKSLVFVAIRYRKFHLYVQLSCTKISYLRTNTHLRKNAAFLHFRLKESSENMIVLWNANMRKLRKYNLFCPFQKFL